MSVAWSEQALLDLDGLIAHALHYAQELQDPHILETAIHRDRMLRAEGDALDSIVLHRPGPLPDTHLYISLDGRAVMLYRRTGDAVLIERIRPARSDWRSSPQA